MFMLSMPPATMTSASPARMADAPIITAFSPEPHTLLMVVALTPSGRPGLQRRLARGRLAGAGLEHLAHDRLVDPLRGDPGALDRGADGDRTRARWPGWSRARRRTCRSASGRRRGCTRHACGIYAYAPTARRRRAASEPIGERSIAGASSRRRGSDLVGPVLRRPPGSWSSATASARPPPRSGARGSSAMRRGRS